MPPILPIPELPPKIREAANRGTLAIFVGAGVSRVMGCQGWEDLARNLVSSCFDEEYINFKEKETLSRGLDHRKTLTICFDLMSEVHSNPGLFYELLKHALQPDEDLEDRYPIYAELNKFRAVSVTTNADELFDRLFDRSAIAHRPQDFPNSPDGPTKLYHLHGSIFDEGSLVFRLRDYIKLYNSPNIKLFLDSLFSKYTVLFVGYGLNELQLLEYVITKNNQTNIIDHYMLHPMFEGEENILEFERSYYKELGIEVIPYDISTDGFSQLYHVIHSWQQQINRLTTSMVNAYEFIEQAMASYDEAEAERVFQSIRNDSPLQEHFFKLVSSPDWLIPIKERDYFDPSSNPRPVEVKDHPGSFTIPVWHALGYLERVATNLDINDTERLSALMEIVRSISDFRDEVGNRIQNYGTDWVITKIMAAVPSAYLTLDDFDRIAEFLKSDWRNDLVGPEIGISLLPNVMKSEDAALVAKLFSIALEYKWESRAGKDEATPLIDEFWLGELLKRHLKPVSEIAPIEVATNVMAMMEEIIQQDQTAFHIVRISSITDLPLEGYFRSYERFLARVLRDCLISAINNATEQGKPIVSSLLDSDNDFFKRVALHVIGAQWDVLSYEFWATANRDLFTDPLLGIEVRQISRQNFGSFTGEQQSKWLDWIDEGPETDPEDLNDSEEDRGRDIARWRLHWLAPIKSFENSRLNLMLEQNAQILGNPVEDSEDEGWRGFTEIESKIPRIVDELGQTTTADIVERLKVAPESQDRMDQHDLERGLQNTVGSEPQRFAADLNKFAVLSYTYQLAVLTGLVNAWKASLTFEWAPVLTYCHGMLSDDAFWRDFTEDNDKQQIVSQVANLVTEGTRDDRHAFDAEHFPTTESLILIMLERTPSTVEKYSDLDMAALNSPLGRAFTATVNYSLRLARLNKSAPETERWDESMRAQFKRRLDGTDERTVDFHYTLGKYLAQFYYLDREWVESNIDRIFPKSEEESWKAAFSGYLVSPTFYTEYYELLNSHNNYKKALEMTFSERNKSERLIHHLCFAYLQGREQLEDDSGSFSALVAPWDSSSIQEILRFFWMRQNDDLEADGVQRVLAFWDRIFTHYGQKEILTSEDKLVLSNSSKMSVYLKDIGAESLEWLKLSARYVDVGHDSPTLIEQLDRLADTSPKEVGDVYVDMLDNDVFPMYEMKHVESSVEKLYLAGLLDAANVICNLYLEKGFENLRSLFRKYNENDL